MVAINDKFRIGVNAVEEVRETKWAISDEFATVCSSPIRQNGIDTGYDMLYKHVENKGSDRKLWAPIGSVSDGWTPVQTNEITDMIQDRLMSLRLIDTATLNLPKKATDRNYKSTVHRVDIPLNRRFKMPSTSADVGSVYAPDNDNPRTYRPMVTVWNGYAGDSSLRFGVTLYRLACKNGMMLPVLSGMLLRRHTSGSVINFLNQISRMNFNDLGSDFTKLFIQAQKIKVDSDLLRPLSKHLTRGDVTEWKDYPDNTVNGMLNFLSYQQTHNASIATEARYQRAINLVSKRIAA